MSSASSDTRKRWNAYQRAVARANVLGRESDELYARWDAASTRAQEARDAARVAHEAYLKALRDAAVVAAAENVLLDIPHAGTPGSRTAPEGAALEGDAGPVLAPKPAGPVSLNQSSPISGRTSHVQV